MPPWSPSGLGLASAPLAVACLAPSRRSSCEQPSRRRARAQHRASARSPDCARPVKRLCSERASCLLSCGFGPMTTACKCTSRADASASAASSSTRPALGRDTADAVQASEATRPERFGVGDAGPMRSLLSRAQSHRQRIGRYGAGRGRADAAGSITCHDARLLPARLATPQVWHGRQRGAVRRAELPLTKS
jgi:hypothetical protein